MAYPTKFTKCLLGIFFMPGTALGTSVHRVKSVIHN